MDVVKSHQPLNYSCPFCQLVQGIEYDDPWTKRSDLILQTRTVTAFINADQLAKDVARVNDAARGKWLSILGMALAAARNYDPFQSPTHFKLSDWFQKLDKTFGNGAHSKPQGVIYIVSGGGGARLYNGEQQADPSTWQSFTDKFVSLENSFTVVDMDGKSLKLKQVSPNGKELDSFRIAK